MSPIEKSSKLDNVCYDIRGPVLKEAKRLEEEGNKVLKLNIGNPAPFGFDAPDEILVDVIRNLPTAQGYCDSKGLFSARKAIMQHYQARDMRDLTVEDIYIGNGVSELIVQSMQALLNLGDEMLVPAPDYPLWTAAVSLSSGKAFTRRSFAVNMCIELQKSAVSEYIEHLAVFYAEDTLLPAKGAIFYVPH